MHSLSLTCTWIIQNNRTVLHNDFNRSLLHKCIQMTDEFIILYFRLRTLLLILHLLHLVNGILYKPTASLCDKANMNLDNIIKTFRCPPRSFNSSAYANKWNTYTWICIRKISVEKKYSLPTWWTQY